MNLTPSQMTNAASHKSVRLRAEIVEEACDHLRKLSYSSLRDVADSSYTGLVVVRDGKQYRLRVRVQQNREHAKNIQVTVTLPAVGQSQPELAKGFVKRFWE